MPSNRKQEGEKVGRASVHGLYSFTPISAGTTRKRWIISDSLEKKRTEACEVELDSQFVRGPRDEGALGIFGCKGERGRTEKRGEF